VRDSFLRQFVDVDYADDVEGMRDLGTILEEEGMIDPVIYHKNTPVRMLKGHDKSHSENSDQKKTGIQDILT
jgi:hypothetical protein